MKNLNSSQTLYLKVLLVAAFSLSIAYSFYFRVVPTVDAKAYDAIAQNIVAGNGYRESFASSLANDNAIMRVGPGYELFLAALFFIFGHHYWVVWVVQAVLHVLTTFLVFVTARKIFEGYEYGDVAAIVAALFIAVSPDLITMSAMLMTETLGIFLVSLVSFLCIKVIAQEEALYKDVIVMAGALGLAAMVRTPALFLLIPIGVYLLWRKKIGQLVILGATMVLVFLPWTIRNYQVYHALVPTNLAYGIDLAAGNHLGSNGELEPYLHNDETIARLGKVAATRELSKEALFFIITNPIEFAQTTLHRISIYFSFARPTGFWFHLSGISKISTLILSALYSVLIFTFGFFGITKIKNLPLYQQRKAWFLLTMLLMMPLAIAGIIVETRYRFLSYPFFAIFAGYGISQLRKKDTCWACFLILFFLLLANTSIDIINNIGRIFGRIQGL